ncbi:hypothetical protein ACS0TY_002508 [Phlomoides rotata]
MGGKGIRRREKNYKAAHGGGSTRLPPPPDPSSVDALPSKLRKLISFTGTPKQKFSLGKKNTGDDADKAGVHFREGADSTASGMKRKRNDQSLITQHEEHKDPEISQNEKKKKKKSKKANDLRFEALDEATGAGSRRKDRKKQLLEARKKKNKKSRGEEDDFPGREEIKFGDVVEAPPKLITVPKAFKAAMDASQERLRLQAVDAYRKRKAWESRPGVKLPPPVTTLPLL